MVSDICFLWNARGFAHVECFFMQTSSSHFQVFTRLSKMSGAIVGDHRYSNETLIYFYFIYAFDVKRYGQKHQPSSSSFIINL